MCTSYYDDTCTDSKKLYFDQCVVDRVITVFMNMYYHVILVFSWCVCHAGIRTRE